MMDHRRAGPFSKGEIVWRRTTRGTSFYLVEDGLYNGDERPHHLRVRQWLRTKQDWGTREICLAGFHVDGRATMAM